MDNQETIQSEIKIPELITKHKAGCTKNEYINELTKFMDVMVQINQHPKFCSTYLYIWDDGVMSIRFPGATRGQVKVDENSIITDIMLNEDMCFSRKRNDMRYKRELKEEIKKFIGYKVVVVPGDDDYENPTGIVW